MISLNQVSKSYQDAANNVLALDHINLTLPETGMIFVVGRSGSGKSTLLHILGGTEKISEGEFLFRGKDLAKASQKELDHYRKTAVSFCFQSTNIFPDLTIEENIRFNEKRFSSKRIHDICVTLSLGDLEHRKASQLSGGQQQRVAIARALYRDTPILLCDEPTGALDSTTAKDVFSCLQQVSRTRLVVVVTHDEASALRFGDRLIRISDGHITEDRVLNGTSAESESSPIINKDETQKASWLDTKLMIRSVFRHPVRSIVAVLLLGCSLGILTPALSFTTRNGNSMLASSISSSSCNYLTYTKCMDAKLQQHQRKMYADDIAALSIQNTDAFPVYKQSNGILMLDKVTCNLCAYLPVTGTLDNSLNQLLLDDVSGLAAWNDSFPSAYGWEIAAGRAPTAINECMITQAEWEAFQQYGFREPNGQEWTKDSLKDTDSFLNSKPSVTLMWNDAKQETIITGILDTKFNRASYDSISSKSALQQGMQGYVMNCDVDFGPHHLIYVSPTYEQNVLSPESDYVSLANNPGMGDKFAFETAFGWISVPRFYRFGVYPETVVTFSSENDDGVILPLDGFSTFWNSASITLPSNTTAKKYADCLSLYCNFNELDDDPRYLTSDYLFASPTKNNVSNLSLLAAGNYVSKNGIPSGDYLQNFISFATNIYKELSDDSSTSIPDFSTLDETKTGYLKSLYTAYLASYQLEMTNGSYNSDQNGGYYDNEFGGPSGISLTRDLVTNIFASNTPSTKSVSFRAKPVGSESKEETFTSEIRGLSLNLTGVQEGVYFGDKTFDRLKLHYGNQGNIRFLLTKKPNQAAIKSALDGIDQSSGYYTIQNTLVWGYQYFAEYNEEQFLLISYITMAVLLLFSLTLLSLLGSFFTNERSYEMIMRRALGSSQRSVFLYLFLEILFLGVVSYLLSLLVSGLLVHFLNGAIVSASGLSLAIFAINGFGALVSLAIVLLVSLLVSFFPASRESKKNIASRLKQLGN